jgi:hypothetical protein
VVEMLLQILAAFGVFLVPVEELLTLGGKHIAIFVLKHYQASIQNLAQISTK